MVEAVLAFFAKHLWAIFVAFVGVIIWFTRLEGLAKTNKDRIDKLEQRLEKDVEKVNKGISQLREDMGKSFSAIQVTLQDISYKLGRASQNDRMD